MRLIAMLLMLCGLPSAVQAQALTVPAPDWCLYQGQTVWDAERPAQNELARITIDLRCIDGVVSGVRVKAETRCGRVLCTWSFAEEAEVDGPSLRAVFFTFTATRTMRLEVLGNQVSAEVINDYRHEGRETDTMLGQFTLVH